MSVTIVPGAVTDRGRRLTLRTRLQGLVPKLVLAPSFLLVLIFVYGFNLWTVFLSFTNSRAFASSKLIGLANYEKLWNWTFETDPPSSWYTAIVNIGIFGGLYIVFCLALGLTLAILLDQKIRGEGILRPIYLYPLALSFIVTGTAWKLFLDPGIGLEKAVHDWGWTSFKFDWVVNPRMMIYCVAIAGIWQTSGFVMAMFLAGLRGRRRRDPEGRANRRRLHLCDLSADRHPDHAAGVSLRHHRARPHGDQILRSRVVRHRQESGRRRRAAFDLHVFLHVHAQSDGGGLHQRGDHADDDRRDHDSLPLLGTAGETPMSAADLVTAPPRRTCSSHSIITRVVIYGLLVFFAIIYLVPLIVMVMTSLKPLDEVTGGNMFALPKSLTFAPWTRAWGEACIGVSDTAGIKRLFHEFDQDGRAGGSDLDAARRIERLCPHQMALPRPQARVRHDAVRLLHPVPVRHHSDGGDPGTVGPDRQSPH